MNKKNLRLVGILLILLAALGAYYILLYPAEYRTIAHDGTEIMLMCGGDVCRAPISELPEGVPIDNIIVKNTTPVRIVVNGSETNNGDNSITTTTTVLPDGTTVTVISGGDDGGRPPETQPLPQPAPDEDTAALAVVVTPKPGQRVEIIVGNRTYYADFNNEGEVVATNIVDLPGPFSIASENAKAAIITYVAAPLIAGLVFTFTTFGIGVARRR